MVAESIKDKRNAELKDKLGRAMVRNDILKSKLDDALERIKKLQDYIKKSLKS